MGEDMPYVKPLLVVVDDRNNSAIVARNIKHSIGGEITSTPERLLEVDKTCVAATLRQFMPNIQRALGCWMRVPEWRKGTLGNNVHGGNDIARCDWSDKGGVRHTKPGVPG